MQAMDCDVANLLYTTPLGTRVLEILYSRGNRENLSRVYDEACYVCFMAQVFPVPCVKTVSQILPNL